MRSIVRIEDVPALVAEIQAAITLHEDKTTSGLRELRRTFSKRLQDAEPETVLALALALIDLGPWVYRWFAYEFVHFHRPTLRALDATLLEKLGAGMDDWPATDTFAPYLAGVAWREGQIGDDVIHDWAHSDDRWWRRAALASTIALNTKARGGTGDVERTLGVCRLLLEDRDDMVVKALSWALRSLIVHDAEAVRAFIVEHDELLAARVKREVRNKLRTGLKNPRPR